jgi:hypothetical protein
VGGIRQFQCCEGVPSSSRPGQGVSGIGFRAPAGIPMLCADSTMTAASASASRSASDSHVTSLGLSRLTPVISMSGQRGGSHAGQVRRLEHLPQQPQTAWGLPDLFEPALAGKGGRRPTLRVPLGNSQPVLAACLLKAGEVAGRERFGRL